MRTTFVLVLRGLLFLCVVTPGFAVGAGGGGEKAHPAVGALDKDKDGIISSKELEKATESLLADLDKNKDGVLSKEELEPEKEERSMFAKALDLGLWTLVVFLILFFVLSKFAWKPMLEGLEKRESDIAQAKKDADAAREEAAKLRAELQAEIDKGHEKIRDMIEEARRKGEENAAELEAKAKKEIEEDRARLLQEIETARTQALHDIWTQTSQVASLAAGKILNKEINADDQKQLVDEALVEFRQALSEREQQMSGLKA